jgi:IclR family pca regulon transcriptional regulator
VSTVLDSPDAGGPPAESEADTEFMATLAKGLAVLTLVALGYVSQDGRSFALAPRVLEIGFAFLSTQSWLDRAEPLMKEASRATGESCSAAILQGTEIVYVARVPAPHRLMSATIAVGARLPAFHTALGRVQLGFLDDDELWRRLRSIRLERRTPSTIIDPVGLIERIKADHVQGFSIVDEEMEIGLRAIAVPIVSRSGRNVGAVNLSAHASRTTRNEMRDHFLPRLKEVAGTLSGFLA